jgi:hypothetical protein
MYYNINIIKYKLDFKLHCFVCTQANSGSFCCALISEDLHAVNYLIIDWVGFLSEVTDETCKTLMENILNQELNMISTSKVGIYVK